MGNKKPSRNLQIVMPFMPKPAPTKRINVKCCSFYFDSNIPVITIHRRPETAKRHRQLRATTKRVMPKGN